MFDDRGVRQIKGKGAMRTWLVRDAHAPSVTASVTSPLRGLRYRPLRGPLRVRYESASRNRKILVRRLGVILGDTLRSHLGRFLMAKTL